MHIYAEIATPGVNNWAILCDWHGGVLTKLVISYHILELASIFWYHWICNIQEGTIHMLTYSYTERNPTTKNQNTSHTYLSRLFISTGKMYTTSGLVSISHVHAVFALPSVPRVIQQIVYISCHISTHRTPGPARWNYSSDCIMIIRRIRAHVTHPGQVCLQVCEQY